MNYECFQEFSKLIVSQLGSVSSVQVYLSWALHELQDKNGHVKQV